MIFLFILSGFSSLFAQNEVFNSGPEKATPPPCSSTTVQAVILQGATHTFCQGDTTQLVAQFDPNIYAYEWSTGVSSNNTYISSPGIYSLVVYDSATCTDTSTVLVSAFTGYVDLPGDTIICPEDSIAVSAVSSGPYVAWNWSNGDVTPTANAFPGPLTLTVTDTNGCQWSDQMNINAWPMANVSLPLADGFCQGTSVTIDAGPGFSSYLWSNGDTTQSTTVSTPGTYNVSIRDLIGCDATSNDITITEWSFTQPLTISQNGNDLTAPAAASYAWLLDGAPIPGANTQTITADTTGDYLALLTDANGCTDQTQLLSVVVNPQVTDSRIPSLITPNGDQINDFFVVPGITANPANSLKIFNRWGGEVLSVTNYQNDWDGRDMNGNTLPDGTYFYILDPGTGESPFRGTITLTR